MATKGMSNCPVCGRTYRSVMNYKDGSRLVIHKLKGLEKPFPHMAVEDGCFIPANKSSKPVRGIGKLERSRSNGRMK